MSVTTKEALFVLDRVSQEVFTRSTCPTAGELDEVVLTTTNGEPYTLRQACELAHWIWVRFGRDDPVAADAWRKLLANSTSTVEFMRLVDCYLFSRNLVRHDREWYRDPANRSAMYLP